ncbi:MAG: NAD(P)-dependent oxidoreductase [Calditrichaeota bacterium]|nr:NAD(P)-dependent oxidoreductase [Calditrichota bacterium]
MNITFIGLGIMGSRMAANLLKNKIKITVYNRSKSPAEELKSKGAAVASDLKSAVQNADVVFTMLSAPDVVEKIATGEKGFLKSMKKNTLWVDCSTVNPSFSLEMARKAAKREIRFLDAPVAGTKPTAEAGELTFFVGGNQNDLEEVKNLLQHMGTKILYMGEHGRGTAFKMLVNSMLAQSMAAFSETLIFGEKIGFDKDLLLNILPALPVTAPFIKAKAEKIRNKDYDTQFPLELMHKDLKLATLTAKEHECDLPLAEQTKKIYKKASQSGLSREDFAAVYKYLQDKL